MVKKTPNYGNHGLFMDFFLRVQTIFHLHLTVNLISHLSIIVEIPEVEPAHPIHTGKQGRVSWRPHHIINII